jgi:VWFA-related protein
MRLRFCLLALAALVASTATAQEEPPVGEPFVGEIEVREVLLDVLVTDREGTVILGLGPNDFEITEDGRPMEVLSAQFYSHRVPGDGPSAPSIAAGAPGAVQQERAAPAARYFIFLLDDQRQRALESRGLLQQQLRAGRDAREFLTRSLTPNDWVAVLTYDKKLQLITDFTRDPERIGQALELATSGAEGKMNWPSRQSADADQPSLGRILPSGDELRDRSGKIYDALELVARAAAPIVGRKNLLLLTTGFGEVDGRGLYRPETRYYEPMVQWLNDANVAVYTLDLSPPGTEHALSSSMTQVSSDTGGRYFREILHYATPLGEIAQETSGYYLVSYRASHAAGTEGFQEVRVKLRNPEFRVTARKGYRFGE